VRAELKSTLAATADRPSPSGWPTRRRCVRPTFLVTLLALAVVEH